jgi:hypothetical protein
MITVLTAAYGEDVLQDQPEQSVEARWLAVTDADGRHPDSTWQHLIEPRPHLSPRMAAKIPKYMPAMYTCEDDVVLWIDCSVRLTSPHAVERLTILTEIFGGMSLIPHPDRCTVADEVPEAVAQGRYAGQMIREQYEFYRRSPYDWVDETLWATTVISQVISYEHNTMGMGWLVQNCLWSAQDQISLPWIAANSNVHIWPITLNLWDNEYFTLRQREKDV